MMLLEKYTRDAFLSKVGIKDYNVMIDGGNIFDQSIKNDWSRR